LVYRRDSAERLKQPKAARWIEALWRSRTGRLSFQVLTEFYQTVTRRLQPGLSARQAREEVREFFAWNPIPVTPAITENAWAIEDRFRLAFWDALIVSAALASRCSFLLSEDLQDGQNLGGIQVVNPFRVDPAGFGLSEE
jgi:predicted nucleic acid-binding protein